MAYKHNCTRFTTCRSQIQTVYDTIVVLLLGRQSVTTRWWRCCCSSRWWQWKCGLHTSTPVSHKPRYDPVVLSCYTSRLVLGAGGFCFCARHMWVCPVDRRSTESRDPTFSGIVKECCLTSTFHL